MRHPIQGLSELLGSLKDKKYGWSREGLHIERKGGGDRKCSGIYLNHFFFGLSERIND